MRKLLAYGLVGAVVGIVAAVVGNLLMPSETFGDRMDFSVRLGSCRLRVGAGK